MKFTWLKTSPLTGKRMMTFLVGLLVVDLILLSFLTRKPVCLESSLISKLVWVYNDGQSAEIYNCSAERKVPLTKIFIEKLPAIQKRIHQLEAVLKTSFTPNQPVKIEIHDEGTEFIRSSADVLTVSEKTFFKNEWHLEKAYLRAWLQQRQHGSGLSLLRLEVLTNFLVWNLGLQDKKLQDWQGTLGQWPQLSTSWSGYCQSPFKDESLTSLCLQASLDKKAEQFTPFSINFWFAQKFWNAFQVLSMSEQIGFFKKFEQIVQGLSEADEVQIGEMALDELDGFARVEGDIWKKVFDGLGYHDLGWNFASKLNGDLDAVKDSLGRVDLLLYKDSPWTSEELRDFQYVALQEVNYRLMGETTDGLWSFPWLTPLKVEAYPALKVQNLIYLSCSWPTVEKLFEFEKRANKVIVVHECNEKAFPLILSGLLHRGLKFFSLDNKSIQFVVVNLDALRFLVKRDPSLQKKSLVTYEQSSERKYYLATKANWSSALWNEQYRAYEVRAAIDAVEWFKLPEKTWPDFE